MRSFAVWLMVFLGGMAPGWAGPAFPAALEESPRAAPLAGATNRPIDLSAFNVFRDAARERVGDAIPHADNDTSLSENQGIAVGPLQTQFERQTGKHAHFARFRLNGVTVFGGSVGGSIDGRSAAFQLTWPTSP